MKILEAVLFFGGAAAITRGAWMAYPAAGWMFGGLLAVGIGLVMAKERGGHRS